MVLTARLKVTHFVAYYQHTSTRKSGCKYGKLFYVFIGKSSASHILSFQRNANYNSQDYDDGSQRPP